MSSAFDKLPEVKEYLRLIGGITINIGKLQREASRLHEERIIRKFSLSKSISIKDMNKIATQETAIRSRLTEILLTCKRLIDEIDQYREGVLTEIILVSKPDMPVTTKTDKRELISYRLRQRTPIYTPLKQCFETCDYIIHDIDQAYFNAQRVTKLYELHTRPDLQ